MYTGPHTGEAPVGSRGDQAYVDLKNLLLRGDFPLNRRLGEERLASLLGVSRTPVREALARLHVEGLVERCPDGGFQPTIPDVAEIRHLYEVRILLELAALRRPGEQGTTHDQVALTELHRDWSALADDGPHDPDPEFVLLDESFHISLADAAGNPVLTDHLGQVNERIRVVRMLDFTIEGRIDRTVTEHLDLLDAVLVGDVVEAEHAYLAHLETSLAVVEERVAAAIARMTTRREPT